MTGRPHPTDAADVDLPPASAPLPTIDDHYRWGYEQAAFIREGRFDLVDIANVADEIESVAKSELRSMRSAIEVVLVHLIKWQMQPNRRSRSWVNSIDEHRHRVQEDLQDNPSMAGKWDESVLRAYRVARYRAASEMDVDVKVIPINCPFDRQTIMTKTFSLAGD